MVEYVFRLYLNSFELDRIYMSEQNGTYQPIMNERTNKQTTRLGAITLDVKVLWDHDKHTFFQPLDGMND